MQETGLFAPNLPAELLADLCAPPPLPHSWSSRIHLILPAAGLEVTA